MGLRNLLIAFVLLPFSFAPAGCSDCDLKITTGTLPDGVVEVNYSAHLDSDCGGGPWFLEEGGLPPGIGLLSEEGELNGVPTQAGTFNFTLSVEDFHEIAFKGFSITVLAE